MRILISLLLVIVTSTAAWSREFRLALPGYGFTFPADHASHPDFKTEWWYYTGHLNGDDGTKYGYELTFFRSATEAEELTKASPWTVHDIYLAHFAVTDLSAKRFFHASKLNRAGIAFAGADTKNYYVWNQNWRASRGFHDEHKLVAAAPEYRIQLNLTPQKRPVLHGSNGLSQKASCHGCASHYYSMTRLNTEGTLTNHGKPVHVTGVTWMDHEFGSNQLTPEQVGWDWFSVHMDDNTELMLYVMRRRDGSFDENSSGTYVLPDGTSRHLALKDYKVKGTGSWKSPTTGATYPMGWHVEIPSLDAQLEITSSMLDQELAKKSASDVTYWEGTCTVTGAKQGKPVHGQAYVEMTGYAESFSKKI